MLFSSPVFVFLFLPVVLGLYYVLHPKVRNTLLLLASLLFYAWGEPVMSVVLLASIVANYLLGLWANAARERGRGRLAVACAVLFNVGALVAFKYSNWIWATVGPWFTGADVPPLGTYLAADSSLRAVLLSPDQSIRLPLGISFFAFQGMSYVIDIYRRDVDCERNPLDFAMYKAFFPQLIAGPIVRYRDVHEQIKQRLLSVEGFAYGVRRFLIGLGKKMLIANVCAEAADKVFGNPATNMAGIPIAELSPAVAWLAAVAYTLQIYFDFSGYSDMAIGLGHMFGFKFLENFRHPYVSKSITEFWRRWHISLSTWFRDYLYIPLGGNRGSKSRTYLNLVVVFFLCGLWHGASFAFVVWGLYHGLFLVIERAGLGDWLARRNGVLRHAYVVLVVMIGWVFFRANTLPHAIGFLMTMFGVIDGSQLVQIGDMQVAADRLHTVSLYATSLTWTAIAAGIVGSTPWLPELAAWVERQAQRGKVRTANVLEFAGVFLLFVLFVVTAMELVGTRYNPFIYFRF